MLASELSRTQTTEQRPENQPHPVQAICITSGKGGVGKSNVTVNLAIAMACQRQRVMLLDADLGLANVDVLLGLQPRYNLAHVISGERTLKEILLTGPEGIQIIPASSGIQRMVELTPTEQAGVIGAFSELSDTLDVLLIDSAAGISTSVLNFSRASHDVIVVICDEPASLTDAYALIKLLSREHGLTRFHVLANRVAGSSEGKELFNKLFKVTERFLDVTLNFLGTVPEDPHLRRAVKIQQAVIQAFPNSPSASAFRRIAARLKGWPIPHAASGALQFFIERLVNADCYAESLLP
jgi:flagellar biosynthesis protein FlhG